jgi:RNA polymerase sigma factor (sigma-70 family)
MTSHITGIDLSHSKHDDLTNERSAELAELLASDLTEAQRHEIHTELFERHLRILHKIARSYQRRDIDQDDIVAAGALALWRAVSTWDPQAGPVFPWAIRWIKTALTREIDNKSIRVPSDAAYQRAIANRFRNEDGLDDAEIAKRLEMTVKEVRDLEALPRTLNILDKKVPGATGTVGTLGELFQDEEPGPEEQAMTKELASKVTAALELLTPLEREIITHRWGLDGADPATFSEFARKHKLGRENVRGIEATAIAKLRHPSFPIELADLLTDRDKPAGGQ